MASLITRINVKSFIFIMLFFNISNFVIAQKVKINTVPKKAALFSTNTEKDCTTPIQIMVTYNMVTGKFDIPIHTGHSWFLPAKKSTYVNFKLINFNPFYNKIELKAAQKQIDNAIPDKFLDVTEDIKKESPITPNIFGDSINKQTKIKSGIISTDSLVSSDAFKPQLSNYIAKIVIYQKLIGLESFLQKQVNQELKVDANQFRNGIKINVKDYLNLDTDIDNLSVKSNLIYQSLVADFGALKVAYKKEYISASKSVLKTSLNKSGKSMIIKVDSTSTKEHPYQEAFNYVTNFYNKLLIDSLIKADKEQIEKGILLYQKIQNEPFVLIKEPQLIDDESDYVDFTLNLGNNDDKITRSISPIRIYQSGGLKIDFSTGIAFGLGGAKDRSYSLQQQDTSSLLIRPNANYNQFFPNIAAFLHVYGRDYYHSVLPALSFGISTNPAGLAQTSFYGGGSLMFRNSLLKRIVLSSGLAAANVNYLKNAYQTDYVYTKANFRSYANLQASKDEDLVEQKFRLGWFVSISYNLSSGK